MYRKSLFLLVLISALPVAAFAAQQKKAPAASTSPVLAQTALVSWETPSRTGSERRGQAMISWEREQLVIPPQPQPMAPLILPQAPNFMLTTSAPLRQYDVEEETIPVSPSARS